MCAWRPWGPGAVFPGAGVLDGCELSGGVWELNTGPLDRQQVCSYPQSPAQLFFFFNPVHSFFFFKVIKHNLKFWRFYIRATDPGFLP